MECCELAHHGVVQLLFVGVNCLCMLAEIVEAGELLPAMASERTLAGVFPGERKRKKKKLNTKTKQKTNDCGSEAEAEEGGGGNEMRT